MTQNRKNPFPYGTAICYSGFREGQDPAGESPSYEQVKEDLLILEGSWKYLRLYDVDDHAKTVLEVIHKEGLDFQVMQGAYIVAEVSNPNCPWGGIYTEEKLVANRIYNDQRIQELVDLANQYPKIICSLSAGNEATVDWTDHLVPVERVVSFVEKIKANTHQPVTFCENYVPWMGKLKPLAEAVDFISIHTYPVWEYKSINEAMDYTKQNYFAVAERYPNTPVVITEAGWTTRS
ncbi:MAG: glycosyl hydrolase, partial [Bacteroidota bacterium]